ncbi:acyltransferase family protein [Robbsia sp. KACC 23696]|uniref:acyltransferase family protein n=1 Tax=Robbsia sp. KACC 23696 TaxID=3149231 RepID=UPI00325BE421
MAEMTSGSIGTLEALPSSARQERYLILDALRFVLALWVAIGHLGVFPIFGADPGSGVLHIASRAANTLVWGMPAVMAFFVVSGFCIHYPSQAVDGFSIPRFYLRRYTRTVLPVVVIIATMIAYRGAAQIHWLGKGSIFFQSTLWSLLCEELYYAVYPVLRWLRRHVGWMPILTATVGISVVWASFSTPAVSWEEVGPLGTAVILYPIWLLGCVLAERRGDRRVVVRNHRDLAPRGSDGIAAAGRDKASKGMPAAASAAANQARVSIWVWRGGAWLTMWGSEMLHFHTPLTQIHTMLFVGVFAFYWIRAELAVSRTLAPSRWLVYAGAWSYSLYLVHPVVYDVLQLWLPSLPPESRLGWVVFLGLALGLAYLFYKLVEQPTHRGAQKIGLVKARRSTRKLVV